MATGRPEERADLSFFTLRELTTCGAALRGLGGARLSLEEVATGATEHLYNRFLNQVSGTRSIALARFFLAMPYKELDLELKALVRKKLQRKKPSPEMQCLSLLASTGDEAEWNSRFNSVHHRVLPLPDGAFLERYPMLRRLVELFEIPMGETAGDLKSPVDPAGQGFKVFHVPEALGSPYIPDQDNFVVPYGIQSVLGFGSRLPTGKMFAVLLFSRDRIPTATAELFKPLALSLKIALLKSHGPIFG
jgi:hypothetical protein